MSAVQTNVQVCSEVLHFSCCGDVYEISCLLRYRNYFYDCFKKEKTCMSTNSDSYVDVAAFMPVALSQQQRCADGVGC